MSNFQTNIQHLVPPLELCKRIPAGEFSDTYAAYFSDANGENITLDKRDGDAIWKDIVMAPAPTLQEILAALPPYGKNEKILACCVPDWADFDARVFGENWRVGYTGDCSINDKNPATAALKLWLKLKGTIQ